MYHKIIETKNLIDFNSGKFVQLFSTDFLNKPFLPIGSIIIGIALSELFIGDYWKGVMKFEIIKVSDRKKYILGKLFSQIILYVLLSWIMFLIAQIVGLIFFKPDLNALHIFKNFMIYNLNILPSLAVINMVTLISGILNKGNESKLILIILFIVMGIIARASKVGKYLPVLNFEAFKLYFDGNFSTDLKINLLISFIYLIFFMIINTIYWGGKEYKL